MIRNCPIFMFVTLAILFLSSTFAFGNDQPLVSNYFYDTYIIDALSDISAQTGVAIIADSAVAGFVDRKSVV